MESRSVIIIGAGGLGKAALDIFNESGVVTYCFLDDNEDLVNQEIEGVSVLGTTEDDAFMKYLGDECNVFIASDESSYKRSMVEMLKEQWKVMPVNAIHPKATVSNLAVIGYGNFINTGAIINAAAVIGNHCSIHSLALVDFEAELSDYVQIGAGTVVGSRVKVGEGAFIGSGVTIVSGVTIGEGARVGAGSVVVENVKDGATVFGNPAMKVGK